MAQSDQCISCKHYEGAATCKAYPNGIPYEIISGQHDHAEPYKGDNGIRFELIKADNLPGAKR